MAYLADENKMKASEALELSKKSAPAVIEKDLKKNLEMIEFAATRASFTVVQPKADVLPETIEALKALGYKITFPDTYIISMIEISWAE